MEAPSAVAGDAIMVGAKAGTSGRPYEDGWGQRRHWDPCRSPGGQPEGPVQHRKHV